MEGQDKQDLVDQALQISLVKTQVLQGLFKRMKNRRQGAQGRWESESLLELKDTVSGGSERRTHSCWVNLNGG